MDTKVESAPTPRVDLRAQPSGPPPRRRGRGIWVLVGGVLLMLGLGAAAAALYSNLTEDDPPTRRAGKLIGTDDAPAQPTKTSAGSGSSGSGSEPVDVDALDAQARADLLATLEPHWPYAALGRPAAFGDNDDPPPASTDAAEGWYLWQDFNGWHLWLVGGEGAESSIEITSDDTIAKAEPIGGEPGIEQDGNRLTVTRGDASEEVVGIELNPGFYAKTLVVTTKGELPLHLGEKAKETPEFLGLQFSKTS